MTTTQRAATPTEATFVTVCPDMLVDSAQKVIMYIQIKIFQALHTRTVHVCYGNVYCTIAVGFAGHFSLYKSWTAIKHFCYDVAT